MSKKSLVGYKKFARFTEHMLKQINHVVAQYSDDGQNFLDLGLPELQLVISGNIKFDTSLKNDMIAEATSLKTEWSGEGKRKIFLAASTHFGEDKIVLEAYEKIKKFYPNLLLIIVPRHPERFSEVAKLCSNQNYSVVKRSHRSKIKTDDNILLEASIFSVGAFFSRTDISKEEFCKRTGYSGGQYYRWTGKANTSSQATTTQLAKVCMVFDWSPTYIIFGLGPRYLWEVKDQEQVGKGLALATENKTLRKKVLAGRAKIIDVL